MSATMHEESFNPYQTPAATAEESGSPGQPQSGHRLICWSVFPFLLPVLMIAGVVIEPEIGEAGGKLLIPGVLLGTLSLIGGLFLRSRTPKSNRRVLTFLVPVLSAAIVATLLGTMHLLTDGPGNSWLESLVGT